MKPKAQLLIGSWLSLAGCILFDISGFGDDVSSKYFIGFIVWGAAYLVVDHFDRLSSPSAETRPGEQQ